MRARRRLRIPLLLSAAVIGVGPLTWLCANSEDAYYWCIDPWRPASRLAVSKALASEKPIVLWFTMSCPIDPSSVQSRYREISDELLWTSAAAFRIDAIANSVDANPLMEQFEVLYIPHFVVIDAHGSVVYSAMVPLKGELSAALAVTSDGSSDGIGQEAVATVKC